MRCNVMAHNEHGLNARVTLTERATYDLLYQLTSNGTPRAYNGIHGGTTYTFKVIS